MIEDNIEVNVNNTIEVIDVFPQITEEVVDINITDNSEDVVINVTESIIEVNINKVTNLLTAVWGSITGTLSDQTDLQSALNAKQNSLSGTGFVKISGTTISYDNSTYYPYPTGLANQYVRGDGALATLPTSTGGGSSVNYYLNGGTAASIGGYYQMSNTAVIGTGVDFSLSSDGVIAQFLTDLGNPNRLVIPAGNWNFESYFSASSIGGSPSYYLSLYKYNGSTFTLIADSSAAPKPITSGTTIDLYISSLAVPETTLLSTDRLAVRVNIIASGKTITLHTQNSHLCQVITTFSTGIGALNGLTANTQYLAIGTSGTDANISSLTDTHTFNFPSASATNRGLLLSADWTTFNNKANALSGTINTLTYWASATTIGSLALASYPSLTEISYIKGLGSAVQTQINTKIGGSGTSGYVSKFNGTGTTITNSLIYDNGTNVGIGTSSPARTLDVNGSISWGASTGQYMYSGGTSHIFAYSNSTTNVLYSGGSGGFVVNNAADSINLFKITDSGSVGIGTTSPNSNGGGTSKVLHINAGAASEWAVTHYTNGSTGSAADDGLVVGVIGALDSYIFNYENSNLIFGTSAAERMRITSGGSVGIGTTSVGVKLVIGGATLAPTPILGSSTTGAHAILSLNGIYGLYTGVSNNGDVWQQVQRNDGFTDTYNLLLNPSGGSVGIGTTSPTAKLQINSGVTNQFSFIDGDKIGFSRTSDGAEIIYLKKDASLGINQGTANLWGYDGIQFKTQGSETVKMSITSAGSVGIGTTTPSSKLDIQGALFINNVTSTVAKNIQVFNLNGPNYGAWYDLGSNNRLGFGATGVIANVPTTTLLTLDINNNRVGIGTTSPTEKLEVSGNALINGIITTKGATQGVLNGYDENHSIVFREGSGDLMTFYEYGYYRWMTNGLKASQTEKMRLTAAGNLGIGTTSPATKLQVEDTNKVFDAYGNVNIFTTDTAATNIGGSIAFGGKNSSGGTSPYPFAKIQGIKEGSAGNYNGALLFGTTANSSAITERMRIDSSGNVGIGYTGPTQKLDVNGNIKADGYISAFNNAGITQLINFIDLDGYTYDLSFENGLLVSYAVN